jgi:hypothetical protein
MIKGLKPFFCYDEVDQLEVGFKFHNFWSSKQLIMI